MSETRRLAGGMLLGAGMMYLLDRNQGRGRRARMRDQLVHARNELDDFVDTSARDLRNRAQGLAAGAKSRLSGEEVDDVVLAERVRAVLGRVVSHPHAVHVGAREGTITLSGPILAHELPELLTAARAVRGVRGIVNQLEAHAEPGNIPALQGGRRRPGMRPDILQENWAPRTRLLIGLCGLTLTLGGMRREGIAGGMMTALGLGLLTRSATNLSLRRLIGVNAGRRAIDIRKTVNVDAPVEEVFGLWGNLENFPRFMENLREVRRVGDGRYHWVATGPAGISVEWDAVVTRWIENEEIAWKSLEGSTVGNAGIIRFDRNPEGGTRMDIQMTYNPPGGALGHLLASILGADPKQAMDEDMVRFKSLFEHGKATADGQTVRQEEVMPTATQEFEPRQGPPMIH